jgi:HAD superfamily hydrolase (TIGR01509 family)
MSNLPQRPKLIIFDLDDTILNLPINYDNLRKDLKTLFKPFGIEMEFKPILDCIHIALLEIEKTHGSLKSDEIGMQAFGILEIYEVVAGKDARLVPAVEETLNKLGQSGIRLAIFSRTGRSGVILSLTNTKLAKYFDVIITREDVKEQKPSAEGLEKILNIFELKTDEAVVVGDHMFDIMAANKLGIKSIAIRNEKTNSNELKETKPYAIANSISEIPDIIDSWSQSR